MSVNENFVLAIKTANKLGDFLVSKKGFRGSHITKQKDSFVINLKFDKILSSSISELDIPKEMNGVQINISLI